jgi:hypothetical protein
MLSGAAFPAAGKLKYGVERQSANGEAERTVPDKELRGKGPNDNEGCALHYGVA